MPHNTIGLLENYGNQEGRNCHQRYTVSATVVRELRYANPIHLICFFFCYSFCIYSRPLCVHSV